MSYLRFTEYPHPQGGKYVAMNTFFCRGNICTTDNRSHQRATYFAILSKHCIILFHQYTKYPSSIVRIVIFPLYKPVSVSKSLD